MSGGGPPPSQDGYYGRPVVRAPVWKPEVAIYFWLGGLAGMSAVLSAGARLAGLPRLARASLATSFVAVLACPPLLISDLGRPWRFLNMLRVLRPTSPMSVGSWVLSAFGGAVGVAAAGEALALPRPLALPAQAAAGLLGLPLATYTAVLVADTSVPAWHEARHHLPFVFAGGATASAGAAAGMLVRGRDARAARMVTVFGAVLELAAAAAMERRLGGHARAYREGRAARASRAARALTLAGAALTAVGGGRRRLAVAAGTMVLAGSLAERFAVLWAGGVSAHAALGDATVKAAPAELGRPPRR